MQICNLTASAGRFLNDCARTNVLGAIPQENEYGFSEFARKSRCRYSAGAMASVDTMSSSYQVYAVGPPFFVASFAVMYASSVTVS